MPAKAASAWTVVPSTCDGRELIHSTDRDGVYRARLRAPVDSTKVLLAGQCSVAGSHPVTLLAWSYPNGARSHQ